MDSSILMLVLGNARLIDAAAIIRLSHMSMCFGAHGCVTPSSGPSQAHLALPLTGIAKEEKKKTTTKVNCKHWIVVEGMWLYVTHVEPVF